MKLDRRYAIGNRRIQHYPRETAGGVTIGEHYAVEVMTAEGWRGVSVHPTAADAVRALDRAIAAAE